MTDPGDEHQDPQSGIERALADALQQLSRIEESRSEQGSSDADSAIQQILNDWPQIRQAIIDIRDTVAEINVNLTRRV